jgi:hypothetical protein
MYQWGNQNVIKHDLKRKFESWMWIYFNFYAIVNVALQICVCLQICIYTYTGIYRRMNE